MRGSQFITGEQVFYDEDDETQLDDDMFHISSIVDAVVPLYDTPSTPSLTFRVLAIGIVSNIVNPFMAILMAYPLGVFMANTLPIRIYKLPSFLFSTKLFPYKFTMNPGPFSVKEHALIFLISSTASNPSYAIYNIVDQKYILGQGLDSKWCLLFALVCQFYGYGFAGLFRKFLVRPAAMLWPANLSVIAVINSFHTSKEEVAEDDDKSLTEKMKPKKIMSRHKFFWIATGIMFLWQWFPSFIAPIFSAVSIVCFVAPQASKLRLFGSAAQGVGFASLSFDWSVVTTVGPITSPIWALANNLIGLWLFLWVIIPILWATNAFGADNLLGSSPVYGPNGTGTFPLGYALNSFNLFSNDNTPISTASLLDSSMQFNQTAYDLVQPIRFTTLLAVNYASKFLSVTSAITHVILWYGPDIFYRFKTATRDLDVDDIHVKLMDSYPEVPNSWYITVLAINTLAALSVCQWGGFELSWWGVVISAVFALVVFLPIGCLQAISGQNIAINVVAEMIAGYIMPGQLVSVLTFKTLTYMTVYQGLNLIQDLKFGHYMKIPPRDIFWAQMIASFLAVFVSFFTATTIFEALGDEILNGLEGWNGASYQTFLMTGAVWGGIGPARFFAVGSGYENLAYCFLVGALLPILPWALYHLGWGNWWYLINVPLIVTMPDEIGILHSNMITPLIVGIIVNFFIKRWNNSWWSRYAYIMSAAFDTGAALAVMVIFFAMKMTSTDMPFYVLNRIDFEQCTPSYYMTCLEHMVEGGVNYNSSEDIPVCKTFGLEQ
ncbi:hypothetical protein HK100_008064 [Physocladia obscura]|uniref:OPT family small oligopeptide transporter n=1 Tax=Physocladia obscura TaxID=109957 RepID=A0AAD5T4D0_9FUNG|nr:hypothetical protein HK100_008064 [Physocladia obscura]